MNQKAIELTGQNTDHGLPQWTTLKWTTPKNNIPNEYCLMFLAASIINLHNFCLCSSCTASSYHFEKLYLE